MRIENYGSFCNIWGEGLSFGTCEKSIAIEKIKKAGGDPEKYRLFLEALDKQDKNSPEFAFQFDPTCMFIFDTDKYPEIVEEVRR